MWKAADAKYFYNIDGWGDGYFDINSSGHLVVLPQRNSLGVDLMDLIDSLILKGLKPPYLIRFPQILKDRIERLINAFQDAISEFNYQNVYCPVFPMKVNSRREVIQTILSAGTPWNYGLEVGSKAELAIAISLLRDQDALLICNGFKDREFIEMLLLFSKIHKNSVIVSDNLNELELILKLSKTLKVSPLIGLRLKLTSAGSGKWIASGGEASKFGMNIPSVLKAVDILDEKGKIENLKMINFHIGSQITDIKKIQGALMEATRIYTKLVKMGLNVVYLNVGGGLGIDYEGTFTTSDSSTNYDLQEYSNQIVYGIKGICKEENIKPPIIVSESGRFVTAHHSILITNFLDKRSNTPLHDLDEEEIDENTSNYILELYDGYKNIDEDNYVEYYHDAIKNREYLLASFNLGHISLEDRGLADVLYWEIARKAIKFAKIDENMSEEFRTLEKILNYTYIANFSLFQSTVDVWGNNQIFPIIPIHGLNKTPKDKGIVGDITCDSDGELKEFPRRMETARNIEFPFTNGEPSFVGITLVGAYQDSLGGNHNLFGRVTELSINVDAGGKYSIQEISEVSEVGKMVEVMKYSYSELSKNFNANVKEAQKNKAIKDSDAKKIIKKYEQFYKSSSYLED